MREQIMMKLYQTRDLTETAALCSHGHPLHRIEVENRWATFIVGYVIPDEEFQQLTDDYHRGELLVEAVDFARRRNEIAAKMRKALAEALPAQHAPERIRLRQGYGGQERSAGKGGRGARSWWAGGAGDAQGRPRRGGESQQRVQRMHGRAEAER